MANPSRLLHSASLCLLFASASVRAQEPPRPPYTPAPANTPAKVAPAPKSAKEERDAAIAADTEKLYQLAEELKVEVAKSSKDTLSLTVIRKAEQIEKLARSLRERMKTQ